MVTKGKNYLIPVNPLKTRDPSLQRSRAQAPPTHVATTLTPVARGVKDRSAPAITNLELRASTARRRAAALSRALVSLSAVAICNYACSAGRRSVHWWASRRNTALHPATALDIRPTYGEPRMHRGLKISVVIPCYNEEDGVRSVIESMPPVRGRESWWWTTTAPTAPPRSPVPSARVVVFQPRGLRGGLQGAGCRRRPGDVIVTLDGDGTYPPEEIRAGGRARGPEAGLPLGAPLPAPGPESAMNFSNQIGNWVLTVATAVLFFRRSATASRACGCSGARSSSACG